MNYMNKRIASLQGDFIASISQSALSPLSEIVSVYDIVHLLADLIENAIISLSDCLSRDIKLQLYQHGEYPFIELSDSGIPFEISVLTDLGIRAATTHTETGGTDTGLSLPRYPFPPKPPQMQHIPHPKIQIRPPIPPLLKERHSLSLGTKVLTSKPCHSPPVCDTARSFPV